MRKLTTHTRSQTHRTTSVRISAAPRRRARDDNDDDDVVATVSQQQLCRFQRAVIAAGRASTGNVIINLVRSASAGVKLPGRHGSEHTEVWSMWILHGERLFLGWSGAQRRNSIAHRRVYLHQLLHINDK